MPSQRPDSPDQQEQIAKLFDRLRDYTKHEDDLINQRLTWNITIQAFAVATYGFTVQKKLEVYGRTFELCKRSFAEQSLLNCASPTLIEILAKIDQFLLGLAFAGIAMNVVALIGISAAHKAVASLEKLWEAWDSDSQRGQTTSRSGLPYITGGGLAEARIRGNQTSYYLPWLLICMWLFAVFFSVTLSFGR